MRVFGLIGSPLSHSYSRKYFSEKFKNEHIRNVAYQMFELKNLDHFQDFIIQNEELAGLNVTIPYKYNIIRFMDELDPVAHQIKAVNCIRISRQGGRIYTRGYNTDVPGFKHSLVPLLQPHHRKALVLGTGGSSKAVAYVLDNLGIEFLSVSRTPQTTGQISYSDITEKLLNSHCLIINATPVGMFPNVNEYPRIPYEYLSKKNLLYDLVYNPEESKFLELGKKSNAVVKSGLEMFYRQAEFSWEIWNSIFE